MSGILFNDAIHLTVSDSTEGFLRDRRVLLSEGRSGASLGFKGGTAFWKQKA